MAQKLKPASKLKGPTKSKAPPKGADAYWDEVGCKATSLWLSITAKSEELQQEERKHVRRYWDLGEDLESLKEEIRSHNQTKKGSEPRRSFDAEAKLALGSKARIYRVQNIYAFFGPGQTKGGIKATAWPYTLNDLLAVIQEMGKPENSLKQAIMARVEKGSDYDDLIAWMGKWLDDHKAAKAKKREQEKADVEAAKKVAQEKAVTEACAAQDNGQANSTVKPKQHGEEPENNAPSRDEDEDYGHQEWDEAADGPEKEADQVTNALCLDLLARFNKDVGQVIGYLIENFWDWDKARDWLSDKWERRSPLPARVEVEV